MARRKKSEFDPTKHFVLNDIKLWSCSLSRDGDYQHHLHEGKCVLQSFRKATPEFFRAEVEGEEGSPVLLRVLVDLGVRSVFERGDDLGTTDGEEEDVLYTVEATFAADYFVVEPPESAEHLRAFVDLNAVHNVWPFWRQHVVDTLRRASLPVPSVPLMAKPGNAPKKQVRRLAPLIPS